jgi:hypothetical protein
MITPTIAASPLPIPNPPTPAVIAKMTRMITTSPSQTAAEMIVARRAQDAILTEPIPHSNRLAVGIP